MARVGRSAILIVAILSIATVIGIAASMIVELKAVRDVVETLPGRVAISRVEVVAQTPYQIGFTPRSSLFLGIFLNNLMSLATLLLLTFAAVLETELPVSRWRWLT